MKFHICQLNWTKWSNPVQGYDYKIQVRKCTVCNRESHRRVGWAGQASAAQLGEAMDSLGNTGGLSE